MENLRHPNGGFIASPNQNYSSLWIRDHLYMTYSYFYLGQRHYDKLIHGIQVVLNVLHKFRHKLERITHPRDSHGYLIVHELIHAKYDPDTYNEVSLDWGHHQLDAIGLLLYIVAKLDDKKIRILRNRRDQEILQLLVFYLLTVSYWWEPDNGIWEEHLIQRSSSIGAVVAGLSYVQQRGLAVVPNNLIAKGESALSRILPYESRDSCGISHHNHDCDVAQLFLIWPFNIVNRDMADIILSRITKGHRAKNGSFHKLVQANGINRYWGDDYFRSQNGISAEWQWEFLISIVHSQRHEYDTAYKWFMKGAGRITPEGYIAEAYQDGKPNENTPLGWMHALASIAFKKLPQEYQSKIIPKVIIPKAP